MVGGIILHQFFLEGRALEPGAEVELAPEDTRHAAAVLRLRAGQAVRIGDGCGTVFAGKIVSASLAAVRIRLEEPLPAFESPLQITLLQSLVKGEKLELIVRQAVELGVSRVVPVQTERSVPRWDDRKESRRLERLRAIARGAAAQCRRGAIPAVEEVLTFPGALAGFGSRHMVVPWEEERAEGLGALLRSPAPPRGLAIFIGPEGGFTPAEASALAAAGARLVHLGPRILRVETAAAAVCALIQAAWGDLEGGGAL